MDTTLDAPLGEAVKEAYRKKQNKEPERGFRFKKDVIQVQPAQADAEPTQSCAKQVTTADCFTVWDFVWKCGALDGDSLECTMRYDDLPGDRQARRDKQSDKACKALLEEARVKELAPLEREAASAIVQEVPPEEAHIGARANRSGALGE